MAEIALESLRKQRRLRRSWLLSVLLRPREAFSQITAQADSVWLLPMVVISLAALVNVYVVGHLRQTTAAVGEVQIPPELQYFTPEQQAQYVQAFQATNGPVFVYVFPTSGSWTPSSAAHPREPCTTSPTRRSSRLPSATAPPTSSASPRACGGSASLTPRWRECATASGASSPPASLSRRASLPRSRLPSRPSVRRSAPRRPGRPAPRRGARPRAR